MNFHSVEIFPRNANCRITAGPRYYMCAPAEWVANAQLLQLCHTSDYWDRSAPPKHKKTSILYQLFVKVKQ